MIKNIKTLERKNQKAIFLGCGGSINDMTKDRYDQIKKTHDLWANNSFFVHDYIVPDYYHLEIKLHRNGNLFKNYFPTVKEKFKNTKFITDSHHPYVFDLVSPNTFDMYTYQHYDRTKDHARYDVHPFYVANSGASLSRILDIMIRLGYKEISFLGVDMYDSRYFWTDNKYYDNIIVDDIIKTCKPDEISPEDKHPTNYMVSYIESLSKYQYQKNNIVFKNYSKKSLLNNISNSENFKNLEIKLLC